jgi:tetratricopeptide (TPR) repeat protein
MGQITKSNECFESALIITRETGNPRVEANVLLGRAQTFADFGDFVQAINYAEAALKICDNIEDPKADSIRKVLIEWRGKISLSENSQLQ